MTAVEAPGVSVCEIVDVMAFAHDQVYGHWRDDTNPHRWGCACPNPLEARAARLGEAKADRLVVLLTKFAYRVHTEAEQAEMFALIHEGDQR